MSSPPPGTSALLDLSEVTIDPAVALAIPARLALRRRVLPFARVDGAVHVACANPGDPTALRALKRQFSEEVCFQRAEPRALRAALERTYGDAREGARLRGAGAGSEGSEAEDAVGICEELLQAAILRGASDIHVDPEREGVRVRLRVHGVLEEYKRLPSAAQVGLLSRFKVLSSMDIAEKRAPQDGRFTHEYGKGRVVELRTATLPTQHGERMTLRLLALETESLTLERLGMSPAQLERFDAGIQRPHGLILVTGPTGSGKSTTLYAALRRVIAARPLNAITVEDPVEFDIPGVAQVEVDSADKVSFSRALRSILRHDPDVVMIGEIRDQETADVAVKAALTGHLVLSTLHTNSAPGAITRLSDMGVERYLIGATVRLCAAQRLVRRLCARCRRERPLRPVEAQLLRRVRADAPAEPPSVFEAEGCLYCAGRGTVGRVGVFELMPVDAERAEAIAGGAGEGALLAGMRSEGLATLAEAALAAATAGITAYDEALAAVVV